MSVSLGGSGRRWLARLAVALAVATAVASSGMLPGIGSSRAYAADSTGKITGIGGNCLTDQGGVNGDGTPIVLDPCNQPGQGWTVPGDGTLRMFDDTMCIGVPYGSTSPQADVTLWSCDGTGSQQWEPGPSGSLVNPHSGLCLDDSAADTTPGNPIQTYDCNSTGAQSWNLPADQPLTVAGISGQTATSGVATGLTPRVSGGYQPYQWTAAGLPPGMSINYVDGTVMGAPNDTATGAYTTTLTVTDERGRSAHTTFTWTVNTPTAGTSWYLNCSKTNDGNGTSASPWNNVTSASGHMFQPGDRLLIARGTKCSSSKAQQLNLQGDGTAAAPIIVEPDPGTSGAAPEIDGNGATGSAQGPANASYGGGAIELVNHSYWIIQGLTVTNTAATEAQRAGISVLVTDKQEHDGITIRNNDVHNVSGFSDHSNDWWFYHSNAISADLPDANGFIKGLTITGNDLHQIHGGGITLDGAEGNGDDNNQSVRNKEVYIAGNNLYQISNNGIVVCVSDSPLIEHNTADQLAWTAVNVQMLAGIWSWGTHNPTFQYNEVSHIAQSSDSEAWDCDGQITGTCTYQYNYDHDNYGGILLNCNECFGTSLLTTIVFRHNVSINDCRIDERTGNTVSFLFTNNTVDCRNTPWNFRYPDGVMSMADNIFLGPSGSSMPSGPNYLANTYVGSAPPSSDPQASTADPKLVSVGSTAPLTLGGLGGYQLLAGSPALGTGAVLTPADRGSDLWGNPVGSTPNRGADAAAGTGTLVQFDDPAATYTGTWPNASCSGCIGGHDHYTTVAGSSVQFKATGSTITIDLAFTRRTGFAAISIDGAPQVHVDTYNPGPDAYVPLYTSPRLTNTTHTVTITCTALKDPASAQTSIGFDGWTASS